MGYFKYFLIAFILAFCIEYWWKRREPLSMRTENKVKDTRGNIILTP